MSTVETVCAVVVTYNRKELLIECLDAILKQTRPVQAIYIIDNHSTDGTPQLLLENGYINELPPDNLSDPWEIESKIQNKTDREYIKIHYVRMHENTGGAGGFHEGVKRGYERGYDWLWLMDDDGLPDPTCLRTLLSYKELGEFLSPLVISKENSEMLAFGLSKEIKTIEQAKQFAKNGVIFDLANPFNGVLLKRSLISKVGFPEKDLIIWGDEFEYYLRVLKNHQKIVTVIDGKFYHPSLPKDMLHKVARKFYVTYNENSMKYRYYIRNIGYICVKWNLHKLLIKHILKYIWFFIIEKKFDIKGLFEFLMLTFNGIKGRLGKLK